MCQAEITAPVDTPEFDLAISKAILASLQKRKLMTSSQMERCEEALKKIYLKTNKES